MPVDRSSDIRERAFSFACSSVRFVLTLSSRPGVRPIADQLMRSATSVGANLEEAKASSSRREFLRYVEIALREARESLYWLRLCSAVGLGPPSEATALQLDADQLIRILTAIVISTKLGTAKNSAAQHQ